MINKVPNYSLLGLLTLLLAACFTTPVAPATPTSLPRTTPTRTPQPPGHFSPPYKSDLRIEFDYPPECGVPELVDDSLGEFHLGSIVIRNQEEDPYPNCPEHQKGNTSVTDNTCAYDRRPVIRIEVLEIDPLPDWSLERGKTGLYYVLSSDYIFQNTTLMIDGYPAYRVATQFNWTKYMDDGGSSATQMTPVIDSINFQAKGSGYNITFRSHDIDIINSKFYKAFETLVASIKVLPEDDATPEIKPTLSPDFPQLGPAFGQFPTPNCGPKPSVGKIVFNQWGIWGQYVGMINLETGEAVRLSFLSDPLFPFLSPEGTFVGYSIVQKKERG